MTVTYDDKGALHKCTFAIARAFPGMRAFHASQAVVIWSWAFSHAILRAACVSGSVFPNRTAKRTLFWRDLPLVCISWECSAFLHAHTISFW